MKRFLTILLVVTTLISIFAVVGFSTYATDAYDTVVSGDYSYVAINARDIKIVGYSGNVTNLEIPEKLGSYHVTYIDDFALIDSTFETVTIPKSVVSIGADVFAGCENLVEVTILNTNCEIFDNEYTIPENVSIKGYENSTASAYAEKYEKTFVSLGEYVKPTTAPPIQTLPTTEPTKPSETEASGDQVAPSENEASGDQVSPSEPPEKVLGDVDFDGEVTIIDATAVQLHVAGIIIMDDEHLLMGDTDKDGETSILDATAIQMFVANLITEF